VEPEHESPATSAPPTRQLDQSAPDFRYIYPEFLPDPDVTKRNKLREKLERMDMIARRKHIDIPEFYVGSILSVRVADKYAPDKETKFVGICIERGGSGLYANFSLRNVVENTGVEIMYDMYSPALLSVEVLKLEKRLDPDLQYLRDCPHEYSTIPFDMDPVPHKEGDPVPLNTIKVPLKPPPWLARWEICEYSGVIIPWDQMSRRRHMAMRRTQHLKESSWQKYDTMREYRQVVTEEDQREVYRDVREYHDHRERERGASLKKRLFKKPKKLT